MKKVDIVPMVEGDVEKVAEYFLEAFGKDGFGELWTLASSLKHVKEAFNPDGGFVAKDKGELIGVIIVYPVAYERGTELFVDTFVVRKSDRGKGVGSQLWNVVVEMAEKRNFVGIRVLSNSLLPSYDWYNRLGLKRSGWVELAKNLEEK